MAQVSHIEGIGWPPVLTGEAARLAALVATLEQTQWLSPARIANGQRRQRAALIAHHARYSAQFARRMAAAGLSPQEAAEEDGFAALGLLTRRDFQTAGDLFATVLPPSHAPWGEIRTAGSTGQPIISRRTAIQRLDWFALTMRDHVWQKRDLAGRFCAIRAHLPGVTPLPDWGAPATLLGTTGPALAIPIETGVGEQLAAIREFRPTSLLVYPGTLAGLLDAAKRGGRPLPRIPDIRTIGEPLSPELRVAAEEAFGARVADVYSAQETGYIAIQCPERRTYHVMAETVQVELLRADGTPCDPGDTGRVVVTDLRNFATPLIRYDTGDLAEAGGPCGCGRGLPVIARIGGRVRNLVVFPDGKSAWPMLGYGRFREIAGVAQYQFVQHDVHNIEVRLVLDAPLTHARETALREHIVRALGYPFRLRFTVEQGPLRMGGAGKFEEFLSRVGE